MQCSLAPVSFHLLQFSRQSGTSLKASFLCNLNKVKYTSSLLVTSHAILTWSRYKGVPITVARGPLGHIAALCVVLSPPGPDTRAVNHTIIDTPIFRRCFITFNGLLIVILLSPASRQNKLNCVLDILL